MPAPDRIDPDDWEELRSLIEDGEMRLDDTSPGRLVLEIAKGLDFEWSLDVLVDRIMDTIETSEEMDDARYLGEYFERQAKRIKRSLQDMEAS